MRGTPPGRGVIDNGNCLSNFSVLAQYGKVAKENCSVLNLNDPPTRDLILNAPYGAS